MFGYYIQEYELQGSDRAKYGEKLLELLAAELQISKVPSSTYRSLKLYKQFYQCYSSMQLENNLNITHTVSAQLIDGSKNNSNNLISPDNLIKSLSFSHFVELMRIEDDLKRNFYEMECIKSNWSIRELKRQISSLYFERTALSKNKEKLVEYVRQSSQPTAISINDTIRDPYIFEFLGLRQTK